MRFGSALEPNANKENSHQHPVCNLPQYFLNWKVVKTARIIFYLKFIIFDPKIYLSWSNLSENIARKLPVLEILPNTSPVLNDLNNLLGNNFNHPVIFNSGATAFNDFNFKFS